MGGARARLIPHGCRERKDPRGVAHDRDACRCVEGRGIGCPVLVPAVVARVRSPGSSGEVAGGVAAGEGQGVGVEPLAGLQAQGRVGVVGQAPGFGGEEAGRQHRVLVHASPEGIIPGIIAGCNGGVGPHQLRDLLISLVA